MAHFSNSIIRLTIRLSRALRLRVVDRYILSEYFTILFLCLLASTGLFLVIDTFERVNLFLDKDTSFLTIVQYLSLKIPLIIQLMIPIAGLIATFVSLGRLSQNSELTAMRAGGMSIIRISTPILLISGCLSAIMFINGEALVPQAAKKMDEILQFDIKRKHISGTLSRANFWFREGNTFFNLGYFNSADNHIEGISTFTFDDHFQLKKRVDSKSAQWHESSFVSWVAEDTIEIGPEAKNKTFFTFAQTPLKMKKKPEDLYNLQRESNSFGYIELENYVETLKKEGVDTRRYEVDLASKISFPLVCLLAPLITIPFATRSFRSGSMTFGFIASICIAFAYYVTHAVFCSLGAANFIPITVGAWSANILLLCAGLYLIGGAEYQS